MRIMIKCITRKFNNPTSEYNGRYYGFPVIEETLNIDALAKHMAEHNSGFSEATCTGVLKAMVKCTKEMLLEGKNVKIDNLAIFSCGIVNKPGGAPSAKEWKVSTHVEGVRLRARATGELTSSSLKLSATLKKAVAVVGGSIDDTIDPTDPDTNGSDPNDEETPIIGDGGSDSDAPSGGSDPSDSGSDTENPSDSGSGDDVFVDGDDDSGL